MIGEFDFKSIGLVIKEERKKAGLTRDRLAEIVHISPRYLISSENDGQAPSFQVFYTLVKMFNISVDQYILPDGTSSQTTLRRNIDVLLNDLDDQDLIVIEYTLKGIIESKKH